jgi:hypothetical protein
VKKSAAVKKAAKTPTVATLKKEISADTRREATLKHDAARRGTTAASRKHDLARAARLGKTVKSLKHELATRTSSKKRTWSPDSDVAMCSARAVAESLRLALGVRLADDDVLGLHRAAGGDRDEGAAIVDVLAAARELPVVVPDGPARPGRLRFLGPAQGQALALALPLLPGAPGCPAVTAVEWPVLPPPGDRPVPLGAVAPAHVLILGLDLPWAEPHAVTYNPADGIWWSWGEPHQAADFAGAVIEECWAVAWS